MVPGWLAVKTVICSIIVSSKLIHFLLTNPFPSNFDNASIENESGLSD